MDRILSCLVAIATLALPVLAVVGGASTAHAAEKVMCHGRAATIVGGIGTPGPDVMVVVGNWHIVDGRGGDDVICQPKFSSATWIKGGRGDDRIYAGPGYDKVKGGPGDDIVYAGATPCCVPNIVVGGAGDDRIFGGSGSDELLGGVGNDLIRGGPGADRLFGDPGRDNLRGGSGPGTTDRHPGGDGDVVDYSRKWTGFVQSNVSYGANHHIKMTVNVTRGVASGRWFGVDRVHGFQHVWTGSGNDRLVGDNTANTFMPGLGDARIDGRGGVDKLRYTFPYGDGAATDMFDSSWFPPYPFHDPDVSVDVDLAAHTATLYHQDTVKGTQHVYRIENVIGTDHADIIRGNSAANLLIGGGFLSCDEECTWYDGGDVIDGRGGDDTLRGLGGDDTLDGGPGNNAIHGGHGTDTCRHPATGPAVFSCEF